MSNPGQSSGAQGLAVVSERALSILQVNTMQGLGGAARLASDLHQAYLERGLSSWLAVGWRQNDKSHNVLLVPNDELRSAWARLWLAIGGSPSPLDRKVDQIRRARMKLRWLGQPGRLVRVQQGYEDFDFPGTWRLLDLPDRLPTIIHFHNLHGEYFDLRALPWLSRQAPLVMTLHDSWLLSGHCAHSLDCERWKTGCGSCPYLEIYPRIHRDKSAENWLRKRAIYAGTKLHVATPSNWLMQKVSQSMLAPAVAEARVIPNGLDLSIFHPGDRQQARRQLGLPEDAYVVLSTGVDIADSMWKDFHTLREAVEGVADRLPAGRVLFLALGGEGRSQNIGQAEVRFIAYQNDAATVARYYQAADVYVHSAKADTFPNTVLEALACGTPVVATAVGGIPEQLKDGATGYLIPPGDPVAMATATTRILTDEVLATQLGRAAAHDAKSRFDLRRQVDTYLEWYAAISARWSPEGNS